MATEFKFQPTKTYATEENARKAISSFIDSSFANSEESQSVRFMIVETGARYAPVVICSDGNPGHFAIHGFTVTG
jgi:hypothetical protein